MATPMTDTQFLASMRAEGCNVEAVPGFGSHDRNHVGPWGPINGVIIHHTGSDTNASGDPYNHNVLWSGYSGLPGPLCHVGISSDGSVIVNSNGRANHAGGGDQRVLDAVAGEAGWLATREARPTRGNSNGVDGNRHFYGAEVMYSGGHPMSRVQYDQAVRFAAAACRHYGWSARSVIGHREWSRDKIDPGYCRMVEFRAAVQVRLNHPASWSPGDATSKPSKPSTGTAAGGSGSGLPEETDMPITDADAVKIADAILARDRVPIDPGIDSNNTDRSVANALSMAVGFAWRAARDAAVSLSLARAQAQVNRPLTYDETEKAVADGIAAAGAPPAVQA